MQEQDRQTYPARLPLPGLSIQRGTMSIDLQTAVEKDMAVIREDGSPEYVENEVQEDNVAVEQEYREVEQQEEPVQAASASQEPEGQMSMEDEFFRGL